MKERLYPAKETYNFKETTNGSHPIACPMEWLRLVGSIKL